MSDSCGPGSVLKNRKILVSHSMALSLSYCDRVAFMAAACRSSSKPSSLENGLFHCATPIRSSAISSKLRPSPVSVACFPVNDCQRRTITSQYFGSSSQP